MKWINFALHEMFDSQQIVQVFQQDHDHDEEADEDMANNKETLFGIQMQDLSKVSPPVECSSRVSIEQENKDNNPQSSTFDLKVDVHTATETPSGGRLDTHEGGGAVGGTISAAAATGPPTVTINNTSKNNR